MPLSEDADVSVGLKPSYLKNCLIYQWILNNITSLSFTIFFIFKRVNISPKIMALTIFLGRMFIPGYNLVRLNNPSRTKPALI